MECGPDRRSVGLARTSTGRWAPKIMEARHGSRTKIGKLQIPPCVGPVCFRRQLPVVLPQAGIEQIEISLLQAVQP